MLLAYLDESYDAEFYWIAALLVSDNLVTPLSDLLDQVVRVASLGLPVSSRAELHGADLFHGSGDWKALHGQPRARVAVYRDSVASIASLPVDVIVRGVNQVRLKDRYVNPYPAHEVVLSHLLERIDERAEESGDRVLVIADEVHGAARYRQQLWEFQRTGTQGYRRRQLGQIVDTMHFVPSHASRMVQAADLVAFLYRRYQARLGMTGRSDLAVRSLWELLDGRVSHTWCWYP